MPYGGTLYGQYDEGDDAAGEDADALHGEDDGDEGTVSALVGLLGHDGGDEGMGIGLRTAGWRRAMGWRTC